MGRINLLLRIVLSWFKILSIFYSTNSTTDQGIERIGEWKYLSKPKFKPPVPLNNLKVIRSLDFNGDIN